LACVHRVQTDEQSVYLTAQITTESLAKETRERKKYANIT